MTSEDKSVGIYILNQNIDAPANIRTWDAQLRRLKIGILKSVSEPDFGIEPEGSGVTNTENDEMFLEEMQGKAIIVDLDWSPEQYEDQLPEDEEAILPDRVTLGCQVMACDSMREIEDMDDRSDYERMKWNQVTTYYTTILVPTKIHMVQGPTGEYPRFWGYICQFFPETEDLEAKKVTISLPSGLSKRIAAFNEDMLNMRADPLEDLKVHMILTTYHGLEEFESKGEKRKAHKFWETRIIEGHRSLE